MSQEFCQRPETGTQEMEMFYFTPQSITVHFTLRAVRSEANVKPTGGDSSNNAVLFSSFASLLLI